MAIGRRRRSHKPSWGKRELAALGQHPHTPTDELRNRVKVLAYNRTPLNMICRLLWLEPETLLYHYHRELDLAETELMAIAASNVIRLANQTADPGVALRANELILKSRSPYWREPRSIDPPQEQQAKRVTQMSLEQVEKELKRLEGRSDDVSDRATAESAANPAGAKEPE